MFVKWNKAVAVDKLLVPLVPLLELKTQVVSLVLLPPTNTLCLLFTCRRDAVHQGVVRGQEHQHKYTVHNNATGPHHAHIQWLSLCGQSAEPQECLLALFALREALLSCHTGHIKGERCHITHRWSTAHSRTRSEGRWVQLTGNICGDTRRTDRFSIINFSSINVCAWPIINIILLLYSTCIWDSDLLSLYLVYLVHISPLFALLTLSFPLSTCSRNKAGAGAFDAHSQRYNGAYSSCRLPQRRGLHVHTQTIYAAKNSRW